MKRLLLLCLLLVFLAAPGCDDDSPQPSTTVYQLFPNGYFSAGFREEYTMTGTSTNGVNFQGTHLELTQATTSFDGQQTNPVRIQDDWVEVSSNTPFSTSTLTYYSTQADDRRWVGTEDLVSTLVATASSNATLPVTAEIGEGGLVATFVDTFGNTINQTWALQAATNEDRAMLVWATEVRDAGGIVISEGNTTYEIDPSGTRQSLTIFFDLKVLADPVSWVGVKL